MKVSNMLSFKLISIVNGFYHYEIYPEQKIENKQILIFKPKTKQVKKNTFDNFNKKYLMQFLQGFTDDRGKVKKRRSCSLGIRGYLKARNKKGVAQKS